MQKLELNYSEREYGAETVAKVIVRFKFLLFAAILISKRGLKKDKYLRGREVDCNPVCQTVCFQTKNAIWVNFGGCCD
jgi:hypothetical protein